MGMYDTVDYECKCPKCGALLEDWQSKDGPCILTHLKPHEVKSFYQSCPSCHAWVVASVDAEIVQIVKRCDIKVGVEHAR